MKYSPRKPYIAINASALVKKHKTGVEWYTWQLLKYLAREWKASDPPVVLFTPDNPDKTVHFPNKNWRVKSLPGKYCWTQYRLLKFLKRYPPALLFSPSYVAPRLLPKNIPTVTVVHGLEGEYYPEFRTLKQIIAEYLWIIPMVKNSNRLIAVSRRTKKDLNYFYNIPLERIKTVLSGPGTLDDLHIPLRFTQHPSLEGNNPVNFLFLGGGNERKNLELAIRIFAILKDKTSKNIQLQIVGQINDKKIKNIIEGRKDIQALEHVSENEKIKQLKSAHFLLYPSFYEGFGFPVLEAQACGAVPIVLKNSGLSETGGQGIIEYDPREEEKSISAISDCLEDKNSYSQLQKMGLKNIQRFSWQTCAREIKKILLNLQQR